MSSMAKRVADRVTGAAASGQVNKELQQIWRDLNVGNRRCDCGRVPVIRIRMFAPAKETLEKNELLASLVTDGFIPVADLAKLVCDINGEKMIPLGDAVACRLHAQLLERTAAKAPSWCYASIRRGPKEEPLMVKPGYQTDAEKALRGAGQ